MKKLINRIIGTTDTYLFEEVLYNGMCFFAFAGSVVLTFVNVFYGAYSEIIYSTPVAIFLGSMYYLARFKNRYYFVSLFAFTVLLTSVNYFRNLGIYGPVSLFLLVIFVFALAYNPVKSHIKVFLLQLLFLVIVIFIEKKFPNTIYNPYKTQDMLYLDKVLGLGISVFMLFFGVNFLRRSYDIEREKNQQQKAQLEKNAHEKTMFFINLSHEIKTPLTLAENYLEKYIQEKGEDEKLMIIRENIQKMRRDVLDFLSVENIDMGTLYKEIATISMSNFVNEKINLFADYIRNKNIELTFNITPEIYAKTNPKGIDHILNNLLENAVKYTPEGGKINLILTIEKELVKLIVQNTRIEIPEEQLKHLFDPFYQLSNEKQNAQGIGMGLYIVKKVLDNSGGQIEVASNKEIGVLFTVSFPLGFKDEVSYEPMHNVSMPIIKSNIQKASDSKYEVDKPCLMVVEDNNELLRYLVDELKMYYNVFVADNGLTAINRLVKIPAPELIISDIMMDTMDGYELLEKTLSSEKFAHIPFIFLTAKNTSQEKISGLASGALDFITKPFSIEELKIKIKSIINQKERISQAAIREIKKQFTDDYLLRIKQKADEIFTTNALKYNLTVREKEVFLQIREGLTHEKIGELLHISEHTVNRHMQNIYEKTGTSSKVELINKIFRYTNTFS